MLFGMVADMPDMLDELKAWQPLSYEEHFMRSGFQAKELAVAAYQASPSDIRGPFDETVATLVQTVEGLIEETAQKINAGEEISEFIMESTFGLQSMIMILDRIVHGQATGDKPSASQDDIDALFD